MQRLTLYDAEQVEQVINRIAARTAGLFGEADDPVLLGIQRRGDPLAELVQRRLAVRHEMFVARYSLKLRRYAENLAILYPETELSENVDLAQRDLSRATVVIVDDVMYRGHSLIRAFTYLAGRGARAIHSAVLVDRCVSQFPVRPSIVGVKLQVAPTDVVECHVPPFEPYLSIEVVRGRSG